MNETFMKEKPIFPLLLSMSLPMVISMMVNSLYNIVDSFFVAQISEDAMTALSLVFPVQNMINAIAIGFGVGINAVIALYLGAGDHKKADTAATHGMILSLVHGVILAIASIAFMPFFLKMFTSDAHTYRMGMEYSVIVFLFSPVITLNLAFEKLFQSVGRMSITMVSLVCGCVTNIVLDPLMIFGIGFFPKMEISGAALATGIGQTVTLVIYVAVYFLRPLSVKVRRSCLAKDGDLDKKLYIIGIPAILNLALPSFLISFLNGLLAVYGQSYVVVLGIYYKLQTFLYLPANGIIQGMRPLMGYNYGAGERKRVKTIYRTTLAMTSAIMAGGTVLCLIFAGPLTGLFTVNPQTIADGRTALRIISAGFLISSVTITASGSMEALGKGAQSLVISLLRYLLLIVPIAFLLSRFLGAAGVWNGFWITEVLTAIVSYKICRQTLS